MCCLFGLMDPNRCFSGREKSNILRRLSIASEARGTDATGIAYNSGGGLHVYKRPIPAHKLKFRIPEDTRVVMGHTRMTTQGDEKRNYNNHPFYARAGAQPFALAHNGVLSNDKQLRAAKKLPYTNIETDSFVAVQLLSKSGAVTFASLKSMSEQLEGSFSFTVLDDQDSLYFVKGDNPLCIYHYPDWGVYLYASTEIILMDALNHIPYQLGRAVKLTLECGDILRIDRSGKQSRAEFDTQNLFSRWYYPYSFQLEFSSNGISPAPNAEYVDALKAMVSFHGFSPGYVDALLADGFTTDDIEEMLYSGEL